MALTACRECNEQISDQAFKCPRCGAQLKKPKRSLFGRLVSWVFWGFNAFMALWLYMGFQDSAKDVDMMSSAERTGAAIGTGIGAALVLSIWVAGAVILGLFMLFTRPRAG